MTPNADFAGSEMKPFITQSHIVSGCVSWQKKRDKQKSPRSLEINDDCSYLRKNIQRRSTNRKRPPKASLHYVEKPVQLQTNGYREEIQLSGNRQSIFRAENGENITVGLDTVGGIVLKDINPSIYFTQRTLSVRQQMIVI